MIPTESLTDPTVRAVVSAINAGDRDAFLALLADDATLSDDGTDRNLHEWIDREIFEAGGHMRVETQSADGRSLAATFRNDVWGEMRTRWLFVIDDEGVVTRMETGQA
ncbi:MAG TPA: nuclear transport factor 2 family protein [Jiangellaceae bacterium]